jgi:hypothetical protein
MMLICDFKHVAPWQCSSLRAIHSSSTMNGTTGINPTTLVFDLTLVPTFHFTSADLTWVTNGSPTASMDWPFFYCRAILGATPMEVSQ